MGLFSGIKELIENARYNRELYNSGKANRKQRRHTAIGWKPDNGYTEDTGCTPSGEREFYRTTAPFSGPAREQPNVWHDPKDAPERKKRRKLPTIVSVEEYQKQLDEERW